MTTRESGNLDSKVPPLSNFDESAVNQCDMITNFALCGHFYQHLISFLIGKSRRIAVKLVVSCNWIRFPLDLALERRYSRRNICK